MAIAQDLAQLLTSILSSSLGGTPSGANRGRIPDYHREFSYKKIPVYDGNIKNLRSYKQDVSMMVALCSEGADEKVVPHLVNASIA